MTIVVGNCNASAMAKEKQKRTKPRGRPFKKGFDPARNLKGKPKAVHSYDREELANKKIDNHLVVRYFTINSHLTEEQLRERLLDETLTIFEKRIIKSLLNEDTALSFSQIIERLAGKVPDKHIHQVPDKYSEMTDEELLAEKRRLEIENRKTLTYVERDAGIRPEQQPSMVNNERPVIDVSESQALDSSGDKAPD